MLNFGVKFANSKIKTKVNMKKVLLNLSALLLLTFFTVDLNAQLRTPAASPASELKQTVGLTEVTISYSRPSAKGRTIFAKDGVVPFDQAWRFGANTATKFTFSEKVKVAGQELKAGSYAVLAMPTAKEWKLMFYPYETGNWGSYLEKDAAATATVATSTSANHAETMTIGISNVKDTGADIYVKWEKTMVTIPLEVFTDEQVMASIKQVMNGPSQGDYYNAAVYYHNSGKDLEQALAWMEKATEGDNPRFWQLRSKALLLADMGKYDAAIKAAKHSSELAQKAGNEEYVTMNNKSIEEWSKKPMKK
jgi:hypothetical protein